MSRGLGAVERTILDVLADYGPKGGHLIPLPFIIYRAEDWEDTEPTRQSFARAARRLEQKGLVTRWEVSMPTAYTGNGNRPVNERKVMCVALAEIDIANDAESGRLASQLYGDILYNPRSRVVQMIMESMADDE